MVDIIGELPESNRYNMILVITDRLSKMIIAILTNMDLTAYGAARLFRDHVWSKHGLPKKVISDSGLQFTAQFMKDLHKLMGVTANISTVYHPQSHRQMGRQSMSIKRLSSNSESSLTIGSRTGQTGWPVPNSHTTTRFTP